MIYLIVCLRKGGKAMRLNIEKKREGTKDTIFLTGRLDTTTAPELDAFAEKELTDTKELVFDLKGLEYISSAGLRVLLKIQKLMNTKGTMKVIHVSEMIQEVFEITGFVDILTIE
jgi:anti-anti-sigma factor